MTTLAVSFPTPSLAVRAPSERTLMAMLIALCAISAAFGRFCFLLRPFDNDAAIFIYMGQMVSTGGRLCHDLIDNKFPTVGLMTSIIYNCLGTCWPAYIALQAILSLLTAMSLGRTAARAVGGHARLPTVLFSLLFLNFTTAVFGGFQLETIQIFFTALAAGAGIEMILRRSAADGFVAGLCAGFGMMFKPTAIGVLIATLIAIVASRLILNRRSDAGVADTNAVSTGIPVGDVAYHLHGRDTHETLSIITPFLGLAIPAAVALLYLHAADLLQDMPALYRQISTYAQQSVFDIIEMIKPLTALALLGFPILIRGFVFRPRDHFKTPQAAPQPNSPAPAITLFLLTWLAIETIGVILQRRMYAYHFLPMVPPAALLFGMLPRLNRPVILAASLIPIALLSIVQAGNLIATTKPFEKRLELSGYLAAHAKPGDAVWMDAWPRLLLETGLRPASRLPFTFLFTNYDTAGLDYSAGMIEDFERNKPAYIILPIPLDRRLQNQIDFIPELNRRLVRRDSYVAGWHRIEQYTLDHYEREALVGNDAVYRRKSP